MRTPVPGHTSVVNLRRWRTRGLGRLVKTTTTVACSRNGHSFCTRGNENLKIPGVWTDIGNSDDVDTSSATSILQKTSGAIEYAEPS